MAIEEICLNLCDVAVLEARGPQSLLPVYSSVILMLMDFFQLNEAIITVSFGESWNIKIITFPVELSQVNTKCQQN